MHKYFLSLSTTSDSSDQQKHFQEMFRVDFFTIITKKEQTLTEGKHLAPKNRYFGGNCPSTSSLPLYCLRTPDSWLLGKRGAAKMF